MASDAGTPSRPKKKRIDLAAIYQGIQESSTPVSFAQPTSEEAAPVKSAFNPQAFLSNVLRTQSLKELLDTDSSMIKGTYTAIAVERGVLEIWPSREMRVFALQ